MAGPAARPPLEHERGESAHPYSAGGGSANPPAISPPSLSPSLFPCPPLRSEIPASLLRCPRPSLVARRRISHAINSGEPPAEGRDPKLRPALVKSSDNAEGAGGEQSRRSAPPSAAPPAGGWLHAPGRACRGRATRRRGSCWPPRPPPDQLR